MCPPSPGDEPVSPALDPLWDRIRAELSTRVDASVFEIWLEPLRPLALESGDTLVLSAPNEIRAWVAGRFAGRLLQAVQAVLGPGAKVDIRAAGIAQPSAKTPAVSRATRPGGSDLRLPELNPKLTFAQFVIGDSNRFAHAAALAVAEQPGHAYSPLFLYGPPGVGKTHLLQSIATYVEAFSPELVVRYTTAEHFTNDFTGSVQQKDRIAAFKARYRDADVLLVDDVQFLLRKEKTGEEFFHTFNALQAIGGQLVISCDRVPADLDGLEDRLRERFESGLVAAVMPPDRQTRLAVLHKRAQHDGLHIDDDVIALLAERLPTNVRALEGALIRVVAFASMTDRAVDAVLVGEVLDELYARTAAAPSGPARVPLARVGGRATPAAQPQITIARVQELVCDACDVSLDDLLSAKKTKRVALARQLAMYLARTQTGQTLPEIGRSFGGRNHTTVMHAVKRTEDRLAQDGDAQAMADAIVRQLTDRRG